MNTEALFIRKRLRRLCARHNLKIDFKSFGSKVSSTEYLQFTIFDNNAGKALMTEKIRISNHPLPASYRNMDCSARWDIGKFTGGNSRHEVLEMVSNRIIEVMECARKGMTLLCKTGAYNEKA